MKLRFSLLPCLFSVLFLCGNADPARSQTAPSTGPVITTQLDDTANGTQINLVVGQNVEIVLAENVTTGYSWSVASAGAPALALVSSTSIGSTSGLIGAGGTHQFIFQAEQAGQGTIQLSYLRPFETGVPPVQTFSLTVQVSSSAVPMRMIVDQLDETASGTTFNSVVGQLVDIALMENGTTGFVWSVDTGGDPAWKLLDQTTEIPQTNLVGAGGYTHFLFRAEQAGTGTVHLIYSQPFATGVAPAEQFTLNVQVAASLANAAVPAIQSLNVTQAPAGAGVRIWGRNFDPYGSIVLFDGGPVSGFFFAANEGVFTVPPGTANGAHTVIVQTGSETSPSVPLTVSNTTTAVDPFAPQAIPGDLDGDGQLTIKDVILLLQEVVAQN